MKNWSAIVSIVFIFLLGSLAGGLVTHKIYQKRMESIFRGEARPAREFIIEKLNQDLRLDPAQLDQLRSILQDTHAEMKALRNQIRPGMNEILARSQDRVRAILRPDQRERYEKIIEERRKRREERERRNQAG